MKIEWDNQAWEVETNDVSLTQAVVITGRIGGSLTDWGKALEDPEHPKWLDAVRCLYWLMLQQDGQTCAIGDVDFAVLKFAQAAADAVTREAGAGTEPEDPTKPPGTSAALPAAAASPDAGEITG